MPSFLRLDVALLLLVAFLAQFFFRKLLDDRRFAQFARANGCEDPPQAVNRLPWGIERVYEAVSYRGGSMFTDIIMPDYVSHGWTWGCTGLLGRKALNVADPKNIQAILALNFKDYEMSTPRKGPFGPVIGKGILSTDGAEWVHARGLMRPQFTREQISDLESPERHVQHLFSAVGESSSTGWTKEVDLLELFYRFTIDTATEFLFGTSVESQLSAMADAETVKGTTLDLATRFARNESGIDITFMEALDEVEKWMGIRLLLQGLHWMGTSSKFRRATIFVHRFIDHFVELALHPDQTAAKKAAAEDAPKKKKYVFLKALAVDTQDREELRYQSLALLIAGRDTTASLLAWVFFELARHPKVWEKLRAEILMHFGTQSDEEDVSFETLKGCRYLQHVLNESLRLNAVAPYNARMAVRDTILPSGGGKDRDKPIAVRKGQMVNYTVYVMHRRPDIWGEDAGEFKPERWEGRLSSWEFLPFNGGPRVCLGQQFALSEASFVIVRMLQRFSKIETMDPQEKVKQGVTLTLFPGNGVKVKLFQDPVNDL
ncbi:MAG: hypothetical protein M1827_007072 [Pycnora praestabilis]|nr:MAG: hypothetical protein M1827_007072 [Pycnora praestabilis]